MVYLNYILAFLVAVGISILLTPIVKAISVKWKFLSYPKEGRWKKRAVAKFGGIAIFFSFIISVLAFIPIDRKICGVLIGGTMVFLVGCLDDAIRIKPYSKLLGQIFAGCTLVLFGVSVELINVDVISIPLTIFWIVFLTNAFNLLDNMDGLSAGVSSIASIFLCIHSLLVGNTQVALLSAILAGSSLGFLRYNFYPAKIFMGDCGSQLLGFLLATMALLGTWRHSTQLISMFFIPVLILSVPIFDTAFVTLNRTLNKRQIFHGGIDHASHRLAVMGLSEQRIVLLFYGISLFFGLVSLVGLRFSNMGFLVLILLSFVMMILFGAYLAKTKVYEVCPIGEMAPESKKPFVILDTMLLHKRRMLEVLVDVSLICAAYVSAHLLRFEGNLIYPLQRLIIQSLPLVIFVKLATFFTLGMYRGIWKYVSIHDLTVIFKAVSLGSVFSAIALLYIWRFEGYSRAVFIIDWCLLFIGICGSRIAERMFQEWIDRFGTWSSGVEEKRVLIFGAGDAGEMVLREIKNNKDLRLRPVGFLDDDIDKIGRYIHGIPVLGSREDIPYLVKTREIDEVLISIPSLNKEITDDIALICRDLNIGCRQIDGIL